MKHVLRARQIILFVLMVVLIIGYVLFLIYIPSPGEEQFSIKSWWKCNAGGTTFRAFNYEHCLQKNNIFFIETSHAKQLNVRQACSVESAARHNPSYKIKILLTSMEPIDMENPLMKSIATISNVQVIRVDIRDVVRGTPLWDWYESGVWKNSIYKLTHLSDAFRLILLWKYGGIYLDLDTVVLHSMEHLRNSTIFENRVMSGSGIMIFDKRHPFLWKCLIEFAEKYDPRQFVKNGPLLITRIMKTFCNIKELHEIHRASCNIDVLPIEKGYPIPFQNWKDYFNPRTIHTPDFRKSYVIHVWNKLSAGGNLTIGTNSVYEIAMKENCPAVYEYAKQIVFV